MDLLRHLRYFVAVAEELHFGRAADRLHMAQPPLSQRIRSLERELGVQLFVRSSRRVGLTPAGRVLLDEARDVLHRAEDLRAVMHKVRDGSLGELRAALLPDLRAAALAGVLRAFRAAAPQVQLDLREAPTSEQAHALREGTLDVGLLLHPIADPALATGPVLEKPLGVLVAEDGELGSREEPELGELADRPLVLFPRRSAPDAYDHILSTCRAYGYVPADVHEAPRREFAVGLVMAGGAVALVAAPDVPTPGATWRPLAGRPLRASVSTAWRADEPAGAIRAYTEAAVEGLCAEGGWEPAAAPSRRPATRAIVPRPSSGPLS